MRSGTSKTKQIDKLYLYSQFETFAGVKIWKSWEERKIVLVVQRVKGKSKGAPWWYIKALSENPSRGLGVPRPIMVSSVSMVFDGLWVQVLGYVVHGDLDICWVSNWFSVLRFKYYKFVLILFVLWSWKFGYGRLYHFSLAKMSL